MKIILKTEEKEGKREEKRRKKRKKEKRKKKRRKFFVKLRDPYQSWREKIRPCRGERSDPSRPNFFGKIV